MVKPSQTFFITGTGTDVGKTFVTAGLAAWLSCHQKKVAVYKPIQTGSDLLKPADPQQIKDWGRHSATSLHNSFVFEPPVAPTVADLEQSISFEVVQDKVSALRTESDVVLVEGAGGLMVPFTQHSLCVDWVQSLNIPVVLVANPFLGTINHTLLSIELLKQRKIPITALVVSGMPEETDDLAVSSLQSQLEQWALGVPQFYIPYIECDADTVDLFVVEDTAQESLRYFDELGNHILASKQALVTV